MLPVIALMRAVLKYAEQRTNHYIAFTLLAIIRDRVSGRCAACVRPGWRGGTRGI